MKNNRLGIFVIYSAKEKVDEYVFYLLENISGLLKKLIIVINGSIKPGYILRLQEYSTDIIQRENTGMDAGAYQEALVNFCDWNLIKEYDELILFNDTFFGPIFDFDEMFFKMESVQTDFWGITGHPETVYDESTIIPEHLQTYFIVIREEMFNHPKFIEFFQNLDVFNLNYFGIVNNFEVQFTVYFDSQGFSWKAYVEDAEYVSYNPRVNFNNYIRQPLKLLVKHKCPILKRKIFSYIDEYQCTNSEIREVLDYVETYTDYDVDLIWDYLLDNITIDKLYRTLNLNYIISENVHQSHLVSHKSTAVIIYVTINFSVIYILEYLEKLPKDIDVYCVASGFNALEAYIDRLKEFSNFSFIETEFYDNEWQFLFKTEFVVRHNYEYLCVINDLTLDKYNKSFIHEGLLRKNKWSNLLNGADYINSIIDCLADNKKLGLLLPPLLPQEDFSRILWKEWENTIKNNEQLIEKTTESKLISSASAFWVKSSIIKACVERYEGRLEDLEYLLPYFAQTCGYCTGVVISDDYAAEMLNYYGLCYNKEIDNSFMKESEKELKKRGT